MITDEDLDLALDRIARTPDGELLYRYLQKILMGIPAGDVSESALRANFGERSVATKLMARMAKGIDESGGRLDDISGTGGGKRTERPVVFATRPPAKPAGRSAREWLIDNDPELAALRRLGGA